MPDMSRWIPEGHLPGLQAHLLRGMPRDVAGQGEDLPHVPDDGGGGSQVEGREHVLPRPAHLKLMLTRL